MVNNIKPVLIVGGGTAGWLAALLTKQQYPDLKVVVVASEERGIIGAGEGTVPHFIHVLERLNISPKDIIVSCKGTIKLGINFVNWNGDGESFWHGFDAAPSSGVVVHKIPKEELAYVALNKGTLDGVNLNKRLVDEGKVPFVFGSPSNVHPFSNYALHFDAVLLAKFFKKIALERGIQYIDDEVVNVSVEGENQVAYVALKNSPAIHPEFVFDCSGLARVILGKALKAKWQSYASTLFCDRAIPFFVPHDNRVQPCTHAIAMNFGWVWKIPVQGRYGCGYVFDSKRISDVEAVKEIYDAFGINVEAPRAFSFSAGCYETPLKGNCLAVGLAHSFLEPMEATSIWGTCVMLIKFLTQGGLHSRTELFQRRYNKGALEMADAYRMFISLHYATRRKDTQFWEALATITDTDILDRLHALECDITHDPWCPEFTYVSWATFFAALKHFSVGKLTQQTNCYDTSSLARNVGQKINRISELSGKCMSHNDFLNIVMRTPV